jgi:hypothetical protein
MATTTVHIPDDLLVDVDRIAGATGVSRNRFVIDACRNAVGRYEGDWPDGFFQKDGSSSDQELLAQATREMERDIRAARRNRGVTAL